MTVQKSSIEAPDGIERQGTSGCSSAAPGHSVLPHLAAADATCMQAAWAVHLARSSGIQQPPSSSHWLCFHSVGALKCTLDGQSGSSGHCMTVLVIVARLLKLHNKVQTCRSDASGVRS